MDAISLTLVGAIFLTIVSAIFLTRVGARRWRSSVQGAIAGRCSLVGGSSVVRSYLAMISTLALSSLLLLAQAPGSGWAMVNAPPRDVRRLYWELAETTEVWVRLTPGDPNGAAPLLSLVFQAFFPGRAARDPYTGLPQWPKGEPARLVVRAEPFVLTAIRDLTLWLVLDDYTFDLTSPGSRHSILGCGPAGSDNCAPNIVEAELHPTLLRALIAARTIGGEAFGFPIQLTAADQRALAEFAGRVGVAPTHR